MGSKAVKPQEPDSSKIKPVSFLGLFKYADWKDRLLILSATAGALANGAGWPVFAVLFSRFLQAFGDYQQGNASNHEFEKQINQLAAGFAYLALGSWFCSYFEGGVWMFVGNRLANRTRNLYFNAVLKQDIAFFDTRGNSGGLLSALNLDTNDIQAAMSEKLGTFLHHMSTFVSGLIVAFVAGWDMALLMLVGIPLLASLGFMVSRISSFMAGRASGAYQEASDHVSQIMTLIRTVVSFGREEKAIEDYRKALDKPYRKGFKMSLYQGLAFGGGHLVEFSVWAGALYYGAWRVTKGKYNGGDVLNVMIAVLMGGFSLGQAIPMLPYFDKGRAAAARLYHIIDRQPPINLNNDGQELQEVRGGISFQAVHFAYPARPEGLVLRGFSLVLPPGKSMALVGSSGGGKSTIIQLIQRFYDPLSGQVLLDGVDLRSLKLSWLRQQMALVSQEPVLFSTSIFKNIAMGREGATMKEVIAAAEAANAHKFISALPLGYDTHAGERGTQLSGGQKQRICIARAILKNCKIMLLDEATSALDTTSERLVQDALDRLVVGRTTVIVAHRLSTIQNADMIGVVHGGMIVELGTHEQLAEKKDGMYAALVNIQVQAMKANEALVHDNMHAAEMESIDTPHDTPASLEGPGATVGLEVVVMKGDAPTHLKRASDDLRPGDVLPKSWDDKEGRPEGPAQEPEKAVPSTSLFGIMKDKWYLFVTGVAGSVVAGGVMPTFALVMSIIINNLFPKLVPEVDAASTAYNDRQYHHLLKNARFYSGMLIIIGLGSVVGHTAMHGSFGIIGQTLARRVRQMLLRALLYMDISFFDMPANSAGVLSNVLEEDAAYVRGAVGDTIALISENLSTLAVGYIIAFVFDWRMSLLVTGLLPLLIFALVIYFQSISGAMGSGADKFYAEANQMVTDSFNNIRVIQAFSLQDRMADLYKELMAPGSQAVEKTAHYTGLALGFSNAVSFSIYGLIIWFGCWEVRHGLVSFQDMLKAFLCILLAAVGLGQAQVGFPDISKASAAVKRVFAYIDRQSKINASKPEGLVKPATEGSLEFLDVSFAYPARPSVIVLDGFNLLIKAGEQAAIVGESGSGKSTVITLLLRFYDPQRGAVMLDGMDIRQYNVRWLRNQTALVSQEPVLFNCSILENVRYSKPEATEEEVREALRAANAWTFVEQLPQKWDTSVGSFGSQMSGGQKQRIAIARAILKNAPILLMDEATSALDASSEQLVQEALDRVMPGRTCITVAHRLSTIRNAHLIAFVYRGRVVEQGTNEELMAIPNGGYVGLVKAQMREKLHSTGQDDAPAPAVPAW